MSDHAPVHHTDTARNNTLVRYGLAILLTAFLFRETIYVTTSLYPGWLLVVLFLSVLLLLVPFERLGRRG